MNYFDVISLVYVYCSFFFFNFNSQFPIMIISHQSLDLENQYGTLLRNGGSPPWSEG